jgi:hypothetical protein
MVRGWGSAKNVSLKELKEVEEAKEREADLRQRSGGAKRPSGEEQGRKCEVANTKKYSRKYPACQLLYWYRSNEIWKNR